MALSTKELGITAVSVHPGVVETDLLSVYSRSGQPVAEGAGPVAQLCSVELSNGSFYDQFRVSAHAPLVATAMR